MEKSQKLIKYDTLAFKVYIFGGDTQNPYFCIIKAVLVSQYTQRQLFLSPRAGKT